MRCVRGGGVGCIPADNPAKSAVVIHYDANRYLRSPFLTPLFVGTVDVGFSIPYLMLFFICLATEKRQLYTVH